MKLQSTGERAGRDDMGRRIAELAPWFHNVHLPTGHQTAPDHPLGDFPSFKWEQVAPHIPDDLTGWSVLDIGCNAGFYTFETAQRGADVTGVDVDEHYLRQARWLASELGLEAKTTFQQMGVYELAQLGRAFDLVLFMGVFYHLRHPLLALDIVSGLVSRQLLFQTLTMPGDAVVEPPHDMSIAERELMLEDGWPKMAFIENTLEGDPTNWWAPNRAGVLAMLRSAGLRVEAEPGHEIFVCVPAG